jgi:cyanuric acid amidohydrolase
VRALIDSGQIHAADIVAVMGKTEGNGCVNDHTRDYASVVWADLLARELGCTPQEAHQKVALVMSGGTEGVLSPHFTVFTRSWVEASQALPGKRLVIGCAQTADFAPQEMGRLAQVQATAVAVKAAMKEAGIASLEDVHLVQVKCPLLTSSKVQDCLNKGIEPVTRDTYESMGYSRGASALGVSVALGETEMNTFGRHRVGVQCRHRLGAIQGECFRVGHRSYGHVRCGRRLIGATHAHRSIWR